MSRESPAKSLDTAAVVHEAIRAADQRGLKDLTMRGLAARLDVQAMSLYRHVEGRNALLDAMVAATMDQLNVTMTTHTFSSTTGDAYLHDTAYNVRSLALAHPWLLALMLRRPTPATWLRRPLCSLACTESFLEALNHRGFNSDSSVTIYRSFNAFLLGHLLVEASSSANPMKIGQLGRGRQSVQHTKAFPLVADHAELLALSNYPAEFAHSLLAFLRSVDHGRTGTDQALLAPDIPPANRGTQT